MPAAELKPGDPYCSACGYSLIGATESGRCPECGRPLVETLQRHQPLNRMRVRCIRRRSNQQVFGIPLWEIALGPDPVKGERMGRARAVFAVGDVAIGGIACGGMTFGGVCVGGMSLGLATLGGMSAGVLTAIGGMAVGGVAVGGLAAGGVATGGMGIGVVAQGGMAVGVYARGGDAIGTHTISPRGMADPEAVRVFDSLRPVVGAGPVGGGGLGGMLDVVAVPGAVFLGLSAAVVIVSLLLARPRREAGSGGFHA